MPAIQSVIEREFFIDNLLVRIPRCFWWTGLAPWEFEFPCPGSLGSTFLVSHKHFSLPSLSCCLFLSLSLSLSLSSADALIASS